MPLVLETEENLAQFLSGHLPAEVPAADFMILAEAAAQGTAEKRRCRCRRNGMGAAGAVKPPSASADPLMQGPPSGEGRPWQPWATLLQPQQPRRGVRRLCKYLGRGYSFCMCQRKGCQVYSCQSNPLIWCNPAVQAGGAAPGTFGETPVLFLNALKSW